MISLKLEPCHPYGLATLGDIMADEEYYEEAIIEYQKALKSSSNKNPLLESEIYNNLGWAYAQLRQCEKAEGEFKKARILDPMNVMAIRNLRALGKSKRSVSDISRTQICIAAVPMLLLILAYIFFYIGKLSETVFVAQFTLLMAIIIFVLYSNQMSRFKMGTMELEMNEREPKSKLIDAVSKMER
jgi:tetratricopeptide (TPR) repeat protein